MEQMKIQEIQGNRDSGLLDALTGCGMNPCGPATIFSVSRILNNSSHMLAWHFGKWSIWLWCTAVSRLKGLWVFRVTRLRCCSCHRSASVRDGAVFLVDRAIGSYGATKVDVNEQNDQATRFYLHKGFRIISRDALDGQGNPFPILHLTR